MTSLSLRLLGRRRGFTAALALIALPAVPVHGSPPPDNHADIAAIDRALQSEKPGDRWIPFGDVGVRREQLQAFRERLVDEQKKSRGSEPEVVTPPNTTFKWPGGNVYYRFDPTQVGNSTITAAKMQAVRDALAEWAAFAHLTFVENITGQPHYITYQEDPSLGGGFSSSVGMDPNNAEQFVKLGPNAWTRGGICHETGHALGLWHEQQRDDRDTFVTINFANINPGDQGNFTKLPGGTTAIGPYDFYSVMHYRRADFTNKSGTPNPSAPDPSIDTIDPTAPYLFFLNVMGNVYERTLSKLDRAGMAAIYGNPTVLPSAVVTNTNDSGSGSLRSAVYYAFDKSTDLPAAPTTVTFHIPTSDPNYNAGTGVFTIKPTSLMVAPGAGTTIDGATQTAFTGDTNSSGPEIALDGSQIAAQNLGLFAPGLFLHEMNCTVKNLAINGFNQQGIVVDGARAAFFGTAASGNVISGCYIGTNPAGTVGVGNGTGWPGIEISGGASSNTVGGLTSGARNLISGNSGHGIAIQGAGTTSNLVAGNYIGTNAAGSGVLSNGFSGVAIFGGASSNFVGGTAAGARNVISGNQSQGVMVADPGTNGNSVLGNYIGTNAAGTSAVPNGQSGNWAGIAVSNGAQNNLIGGTVPGSGNLISGNTAQGVAVSNSGSTGNRVQGNFIGTNAAGTAALPNSWSGVAIFGGAQSNTVGGLTSGARNLISGNNNQGIVLADSGTNLNLVQGNFIGVNAAGTLALPNVFAGISIFGGAQSNTIGGTVPGARNVIAGNQSQGMTISDAATAFNLVQGNYLGLDLNGVSAIGNSSGIDIFGGAHGNTIGSTSGGGRNYIAGNSNYGISLSGSGTNGNLIQGNTIGLNVAGAIVANGAQGVAIFGGAQSNGIGGTSQGASNVISGNGSEGVATFDSGTIRNAISQNSIFSNHFNGIGVYSSSSNGQAAPVLTAASLSSATNPNGTDISGTLNSTASTTFRIEFFASPGGTAEGRNFIGATSVATNGSGAGAFGPIPLAATVPIAPLQAGGSVITATATDPNGNTSQFSSPINVVAGSGDIDNDGIPNSWMTAHFGHADGQSSDKSRAIDDADGDGLTNLQEFRAGTDPKLASSFFRITTVGPSGNDLALSFASVSGKTYRVEFKDDLPNASWNLFEDQVFATGGNTPMLDPGALSLSRRFYRVTIEP